MVDEGVAVVVCWLLNVPATCKCISGTDLLRQPTRWPSGLGVRLGSGRPGVRIPLATGFFRVESYQWLPCQAPGSIGSVLGLVGQVSVYCDWVR